MLDLRPNCEMCDKDLAPHAHDARICSYECTYCKECAEGVLQNVCPTCGGNLVQRPMRPNKAWRTDKKLGLGNHPASTKRVHTPYSMDEINAHVDRIKHFPPEDR